MRKAYLVVHLDVKKTPPEVSRAGIYSEPAESLTGAIGPRSFAFDVIEASGEDYETARLNLLARLRDYGPILAWAHRLIPEGDWKP